MPPTVHSLLWALDFMVWEFKRASWVQAAGLERYLTRKLQHFRNGPADATATALALWLLELLLARQHAATPAAALQPHVPLPSRPSAGKSPPSGLASTADRSRAAADPADQGEWLTVQQLLEDYKAHLPFFAVEQVLRDSNCRKELIFATRLYGDWSSLFELLMPGVLRKPRCSFERLPLCALPRLIADRSRLLRQCTLLARARGDAFAWFALP